MLPSKVQLDISSVHARPTRRPSAYEEHKSNLKKLLRHRQKQIQAKREKITQNVKIKKSSNQVNTIYIYH